MRRSSPCTCGGKTLTRMRGKASDGVLRTHITLRPLCMRLRRKHGAQQQLCPDHAACVPVHLFNRVPLWRATWSRARARLRHLCQPGRNSRAPSTLQRGMRWGTRQRCTSRTKKSKTKPHLHRAHRDSVFPPRTGGNGPLNGTSWELVQGRLGISHRVIWA